MSQIGITRSPCFKVDYHAFCRNYSVCQCYIKHCSVLPTQLRSAPHPVSATNTQVVAEVLSKLLVVAITDSGEIKGMFH